MSLLLSFGVAQNAWALNGNELLDACQIAERLFDTQKEIGKDPNANYCVGVINGVTSMVVHYETLMKNFCSSFPFNTCYPEKGFNTKQAVRIVVKYLKDNPKELHLEDDHLIMNAIRKAFQCK
jgi:hypothetical protein